jgi:fucose permease
MVMSLGRGDIKTAFRENAVLMILIPIWVIIAILYKTDIFKKHFNREKMLEILAVISLVIFIVFGVIRNIPYFELLRPI